MAETESAFHQVLWDKKDELLELIRNAVDSLGIDLDVNAIDLRIRHVHQCPPGYTPAFEPVEHPDGSVTYEWVCKKL
jgi:hypothetical protein